MIKHYEHIWSGQHDRRMRMSSILTPDVPCLEQFVSVAMSFPILVSSQAAKHLRFSKQISTLRRDSSEFYKK